MSEEAKGYGFDITKPLPAEMIEALCPQYRPFAEAGREWLERKDMEHYKQHRHDLFQSPVCMSVLINRGFQESGEATGTGVDRFAPLVGAYLCNGILLGVLRESARSGSVLASLLGSLSKEAGGDDNLDRPAGFQQPKKGQA